MRGWAEWLYDHRVAAATTILLITAFFAWEGRKLNIESRFRDLYPENHPHTKLFEKYPKFSSPFTVSLAVQVRQGCIYNPQTLRKIQEATRLVDLLPGIDHDQVVSIASRKVKHVQVTAEGLHSANLLVAQAPEKPEEIEKLRERVRSATGVIGNLVSRNEDAALIQATFIEGLIDYQVIFDGVNKIIEKLRDENHELYAAGWPMLIGWVHFYQGQMLSIFALTLLGMILILTLHMRNVAGVLTPILVSAATSLWGIGFAAFLGINIDPLTLVLLILLIARSFSHAIQACERYFEIYADTQNKRAACVGSLVSIFPPGVLGVITDAAGLFLISVAPIPILHKVALVCGFWSLSLIPANVLFTPIVLSLLPVPRNAAKVIDSARVAERRLNIFDRAVDRLRGLAVKIIEKRSCWTLSFLTFVLIWAGFTAAQARVGDVNPGTSLLWPSSPYNTAVKRINEKFAGFDVMHVVVEASGPEDVRASGALEIMQRLQRYVERDPEVGGSFSFADLVSQVNRLFHDGLPKWGVIPEDNFDAALLSQLAMSGATADEFSRYVTTDFSAANVSVWYKDHRGETIRRALNRAERFVRDELDLNTREFKIRLAAGTIGLLAAVNETVARSEVEIFLLVLVAVFLTCSMTYRSFVAALFLLVPVNVANIIAKAAMVQMGVALDVHTLPVAAVGIGVGIDYGIYLMSRICEECRIHGGLDKAVSIALNTTGRAIFFTATTVMVGVAPWYLLSELRFQAEMGLLIVFFMVANMAVAQVLVPLLLLVFQPAFVARSRR